VNGKADDSLVVSTKRTHISTQVSAETKQKPQTFNLHPALSIEAYKQHRILLQLQLQEPKSKAREPSPSHEAIMDNSSSSGQPSSANTQQPSSKAQPPSIQQPPLKAAPPSKTQPPSKSQPPSKPNPPPPCPRCNATGYTGQCYSCNYNTGIGLRYKS